MSDAPVASRVGLPFLAMCSISSVQVMSPEPILNAGTNGSRWSIVSKSYGVE
jgi:hypothetical protein